MIEFKSIDRVQIPGRGSVFVVENDQDRPLNNSGLIGEIVLIDGKKYNVKSVESFCMHTIWKGQRIGLLVSERK